MPDHRVLLACLWQAQIGSLEGWLDGEDGLGRDVHQTLADGRTVDPESAAEAAEVCGHLVEVIQGVGEKARVVTTYLLRAPDFKRDQGRPDPHRGAYLADTAPGVGEAARDPFGEPRILRETVGTAAF